MQYFSLNKTAPDVDFKEAAVRGQAPDKGLYFPRRIPTVEKEIINNITNFSKEELAFRIMLPYVGTAIPEKVLYQIVSETIDFPFPLVPITENISSLELFHGPTMAFKDVGARFMSRCLGYFSRGQDKKVTVLVATSGDTGGAVANGFLGVEGVEVIILYPSGKVSPVQELQLTTCGQNITALEVKGSFDDCQAMVKDAFMDADLNAHYSLTSANSINVARWLPQQLYYFFAYQQWPNQQELPVVAVPSGNFGNICAGLLAQASGLPVKHFIAACNVNDAVPEYLRTGSYQPKKAVATVSNAMDVGSPSNFIRVMELFHNDHTDISKHLSGYTVSDAVTEQTIAGVFNRYHYVLDPHGAVAYHALADYLYTHPGMKGMILETAHPVKFPETVSAATGKEVTVPPEAQYLFSRKKQRIVMEPSFSGLKEWLLQR
ncbi:threonine synthase [Hydrobacter penzbergensis]|uniref:Threonine synthase n=1 Tax=Hydrobacter penzbergensis TaxID=1235997 RepID=A0A8X8IIF8_9BACT|nr:threonine synthase [Hydrobacter penzbergensis]SDX48585.1 threonine synthase [Hydrobacter penzbergensis]